MDGMTKDVMKIAETCRKCRYNRRGALDEPCMTGIRMIHYSGACAAYRPSLWTIVKRLIEKDGEQHDTK